LGDSLPNYIKYVSSDNKHARLRVEFVIRSYPLPIKKRRACFLSGAFYIKCSYVITRLFTDVLLTQYRAYIGYRPNQSCFFRTNTRETYAKESTLTRMALKHYLFELSYIHDKHERQQRFYIGTKTKILQMRISWHFRSSLL